MIEIPSFFGLAVIALAAWRLGRMIQEERLPWDVLVKVRRRLGIQHDQHGRPVDWPKSVTGRLLGCFWCLSIWTGILGYLLWILVPLIAVILAASGLAIVVNIIMERVDNG